MSIDLNHIWEELSVPLKSFIKKRIDNDTDADDILQDVFLKIHNSIGDLRDEDKIHAWVYRITQNAIIDYYRRSGKSIELPLVSEDVTMEPDKDLNSNVEISTCLRAMIECLPDKYKKAILLTEFQNLTQKELSERMGITLSGAKSRVQRGREKLKEMLLGCCHLEFDRHGNVIDYKHKSSECKYC